MSDTPSPAPAPVSFNNTWKAVITIAVLLFNAWIIVYCILWGKEGNSAQATSLSWAFITDLLILGGLGVGQFTPDIVKSFTGK